MSSPDGSERPPKTLSFLTSPLPRFPVDSVSFPHVVVMNLERFPASLWDSSRAEKLAERRDVGSGRGKMLKLRVVTVAAALALSACAPRNSNPNAPNASADPEKVSRAEYDLASDDWKHGRLRGAMEHALKASAIDDGHAEAHHFVAILFMALCQTEGDCRWGEAEKYARKAVAADVEFRPARHTLGVILIQEKKYDEAIAVLRPLAEDILYKTPELAWYDLGGAYLERGDADQAVEALSKAIALKPTFCWANYRLGLAFEKKGLLGEVRRGALARRRAGGAAVQEPPRRLSRACASPSQGREEGSRASGSPAVQRALSRYHCGAFLLSLAQDPLSVRIP